MSAIDAAVFPANTALLRSRDVLSPRGKLVCPSCEGAGTIQFNHSPSFYDPYYCEERTCTDCGGAGAPVGDLAVALQIKADVMALRARVAAVRISDVVDRELSEIADLLDVAVSDYLDGGAIFALTRGRAA
jgi:hypothetical protein